MKNTAICENHLYAKAYRRGKRAVGRYTAVYVLRDYAAGKIARADPRRGLRNRVGLTVGKSSAERSSATAPSDLCARHTALSRRRAEFLTAGSWS